MEKQVILSKKEFDTMEEELKTLNKIVDSKKISALVIPRQNWGLHTFVNLGVEYILDIEEHQVIKDLEFEIKRLNEKLNVYEDRIWKTEYELNSLRGKLELEQSKPWYKKLFSIKK